MYQTIMVPLDGSAFSERALPIAAVLARAMDAKLVLVRSFSAVVLPGTDPIEAEVRAGEEVEAYLSAQVAGLREQGLRVEAAQPHGDAAESILLEIRLRQADLVVMCTHGRSGLGRWIYGSVAEGVLAHSPVPVLLVRPTGGAAILALETAKAPLLVPLDGSPLAEVALPHAVFLSRKLDVPLVLLQVVGPPLAAYGPHAAGYVQETYEDELREATSYLEGVAESLEHEGLPVRTMVLEGWPVEVIADQAIVLRAGLIVMATHGRTGLRRAILGSVACEVIRHSAVPVMLVRPA